MAIKFTGGSSAPLVVSSPSITAECLILLRFRAVLTGSNTCYFWYGGKPNGAYSPPTFSIIGTSFYFQSGTSASNNKLWSCSSTAVSDTHYDVAIKYDPNETADPPIVWINGTEQTMTYSSGPATITSAGSVSSHVLGGVLQEGTAYGFTETKNTHDSWHEAFHFWPDASAIGALEMFMLTSKPLIHFPERIEGGYHFYFEGLAPGTALSSAGTTLYPDADVSTSGDGWPTLVPSSPTTRWDKLDDSSEADYIRAGTAAVATGGALFDMSTYTIAGSVKMMDVMMRASSSTITMVMNVWGIPGGAPYNINKVADATPRDYKIRIIGSVSQSQLNGFQVELGHYDVPKNSTATVYYVQATPYDHAVVINDYLTGTYSCASSGGITFDGSWLTK